MSAYCSSLYVESLKPTENVIGGCDETAHIAAHENR